MIRVKMSALLDFQFQFFVIFENFLDILSIQHIFIPNYYIRDNETIRILDIPSFVLNLIKNQRRICLLL